MGDLGKTFFASQVCSESQEVASNPVSALASHLLMGPDSMARIDQLGDGLEDGWEEAEMQAQFQQVYAETDPEVTLQGMEEAWKGQSENLELEQAWNEDIDEKQQQEMEGAWEEAGVQVTEELWRDLLKKQSSVEYSFAPTNPYLAESSPLSLAQSLDSRGLIPEAILALEAEVKQNPASSEAWRRLGELQAECDNDAQALAALLAGLEVDPFNIDSLLAIGVSSLNEVRPEEVVRYFALWIERNPEYTGLTVNPGAEGIIAALEAACEMQPTDVKAATALGVMYVQTKRFIDAERVFKVAIALEPQNYTLWNKLAAAQYLQGKDAISTYEKVLDLRATYIRAWANLASCYWRQGSLHVAARFILCALALNPSDKHLWGKLATMFLLMERLDLVKKIESQDPYVFSDEFEIVRRESLSV